MLGEKILNLRKKYGITQEQLGEKIDVTRQTISNWELGETNPNPEQLKLLSQVLNVSVDELLGNDTQNILEKRIINTENLSHKQIKFSKIILITLYFIILSSLIFFIFHIITKKDFTDYYQTEFTCSIKNKEWQIYLSTNDNNENVIVTYIKDIDSTEEYLAGDSIYEELQSLNILKKIILKHGGTCK